MKTILFVGDLSHHSRSYQRFRALQDLGYMVKGISFTPDNTLPGISQGLGLWYRVRYKLGYPIDETGVNRKILTQVGAGGFDLLWIEKGLTINPVTLEKAKRLYPNMKIVSYSEDDMFARHNQSTYYCACLPLYDTVFTTKSYNCNSDELPALGARRVVFLDNAYDIHTHYPVPIDEKNKETLGADVGFIGTFEQDRAEKMLFLAESGVEVRIWGNGWESWVGKHPRLRVENRPIYNKDYIKSICGTKINLCFLRKINRDLQTSRTLEIPACGAFMLAERTSEHQRLFKEGKEAAYFDVNDEQELLDKVQYYLAHDVERQEIAGNGRQRCLKSGYSHHDRLRWIMEEVIFRDSSLVVNH